MNENEDAVLHEVEYSQGVRIRRWSRFPKGVKYVPKAELEERRIGECFRVDEDGMPLEDKNWYEGSYRKAKKVKTTQPQPKKYGWSN